MDGLKLYFIFLILFGVGMGAVALLDDRRQAKKRLSGVR